MGRVDHSGTLWPSIHIPFNPIFPSPRGRSAISFAEFAAECTSKPPRRVPCEHSRAPGPRHTRGMRGSVRGEAGRAARGYAPCHPDVL